MRSIWKGYIRFSLVTIPVRIFNAVDAEDSISFKQLHKDDHGPVGYDKKCKTCGKVLGSDEIVKGYEFEPGKFVLVTNEDLAKIRLESTRVLEIQGFIDASEVRPALYDSPYLLGPDGPLGAKSYGLLAEAMRASGKVGIGKIVLSNREEAAIIAPEEGGMMLYKLRQPKELRRMEDVPQVAPLAASKDELRLSLSLVDSMATTLEEVDLTDRYRDALRELLDAKVAGREIVANDVPVAPVTDIIAALEESLAAANAKRKPMERAKGAKKTAVPPAAAPAEKRQEKPARQKKPRVA